MIVVAGEALVDLVIDPGGAVTATLGGAPFNVARTCGRLGSTVSFAGALSDDRLGSMLTARLGADGVDVDAAPRVPLPTTLAAAELDGDGVATYRFYVDGTSAPALDRLAVPPGATTVVTGGLALVLEPMATTIASALGRLGDDVLAVVDLNCRPPAIRDEPAYRSRVDEVLARADVVKVSDDDLAYLDAGRDAVDAAAALLDRGVAVVLLTAGGRGVTVLTREGRRHVASEVVDVVDTIGAGDAFVGGFVSWWEGRGLGRGDLGDPEKVTAGVAAANAVAGVACTRRGAEPPWRGELAASWSG